MNKSELIEQVAKQAGVDKKTAGDVLKGASDLRLPMTPPSEASRRAVDAASRAARLEPDALLLPRVDAAGRWAIGRWGARHRAAGRRRGRRGDR